MNDILASQKLKNVKYILYYLAFLIATYTFSVKVNHVINGDGQLRFKMIQSIIESGNLFDANYSYIQPLFAIPAFLLGKITGMDVFFVEKFNLFLLFLATPIFYYVMRNWLDRSSLLIFLLLLISASMFPNHIKYFYGEVFTALSVFLGILFLSRGKFILGAIFIGLGTASSPATLVGAILLFVGLSITQKRLRYLLFSILPILLILLENKIRRGNFFAFGYTDNKGFVTILPYSGREGFSYPFFLGVLSILFSFGKGLIFFAPASILYFRLDKNKFSPEVQTTLKLSFFYILGLILVYAKWWSWYGGWFWGPRFFLFTSIFSSLLLTLFLLEKKNFQNRLISLLLITLSFWIGYSGLVHDQYYLEITCKAENYAKEFLCWYLPEFSVLWHPLILSRGLTPKEIFIRNFYIFSYLIITIPIWYTFISDLVKQFISYYKSKGSPKFTEFFRILRFFF